MRGRIGIMVLVGTVALTGCGGEEKDTKAGPAPRATSSATPQAPSTGLTETVVPCAEFAATAQKIADAQQQLYSGQGENGAKALATLVEELDGLKDGAPDDVREALTTMSAAFRAAGETLADPTPEKQAELTKIAPTIATAGRTIADYVVARCQQ